MKLTEYWQYLLLEINAKGDKWQDSLGRTGQLIDNESHQGIGFAGLLNWLGGEGWELIINNPYTMGSGFGTLVFKRRMT